MASLSSLKMGHTLVLTLICKQTMKDLIYIYDIAGMYYRGFV